MSRGGFPIIRIGPGKGLITLFVIDQSQISVDPLSKVNPMRVVFSCCQNESLLTEKPGIYVDLSFSFNGELLFQPVCKKFNVYKTVEGNQIEKTAYLTVKPGAHFSVIIGSISEGFGFTEKIQRSESIA
jgi:hypothetical protein